MPTIIATVGSASANSHVTEVEFIAYLASRLNVHSGATVSGTTCTETEKSALIEATRDLTVLTWKGTRTDAVQALSWPREYVENPDAPGDAELGELGVPQYGDDEIPRRVKDATCELALQYLKAGTTDLAMPDGAEGIRREKVGPLETEFFDPGQRQTRGLARFPRVMALVAPLLRASAGGLTVVRV